MKCWFCKQELKPIPRPKINEEQLTGPDKEFWGALNYLGNVLEGKRFYCSECSLTYWLAPTTDDESDEEA